MLIKIVVGIVVFMVVIYYIGKTLGVQSTNDPPSDRGPYDDYDIR